MKPLVSVVILNWNGKRFLSDCLTSLRHVTYKPLEVILVDNNSSDGSVPFVKKKFPWVRVVASLKNNGFARGNNIGAEVSTGKYVLFLNNDTKVEPDFLSILMNDFLRDSTLGCIQPQMRVMDNPDLLDEAGAYMTPNGFLYHYGYRKPFRSARYRKPRIIYSAKGACMLIPKDVFNFVGKFDEDFFIFFEETDLCHRIWLAGFKVLYEPRASIYHLAGGDTTDKYNYARRIYLTIKNMNMAYLKNFGLRNFLTIYPLFVLTQALLAGYFLVTLRFLLVRAIIRGWWYTVSHVTRILRKRKAVQRMRKTSDTALWKSVYYNPGIRYYYYLLFNAKKFRDEHEIHPYENG